MAEERNLYEARLNADELRIANEERQLQEDEKNFLDRSAAEDKRMEEYL